MVDRTGKKTHDDEVSRQEGIRQSATRASGRSQAAAKAADIVFYRACLASARSQGVEQGNFIHALWTLGVRDP